MATAQLNVIQLKAGAGSKVSQANLSPRDRMALKPSLIDSA